MQRLLTELPGACGLLLVAGFALALAACQVPAAVPAQPAVPAAGVANPAAQPAASGAARPAGWDQLVQAARQEGKVVVYGPPGAEYRRALIDAFESAYPGVKVEATFADVNEQFSRLSAERTAGRYVPDVWVSGTSPTVTAMKEGGFIVPLPPALALPEVLDASAWLQNRLWWADSAEPYTTLMFQGSVNNIVSYNTRLVNPAEVTSYWDLLDPRWRGKIVATDVRRPGPGGVPSRFIYKHPGLGPEFIERLFAEAEVTLSSDQRQMVDWLSQGQYALGVFVSDREIHAAAQQGLPVATMPAGRMKEGAPIGPAYGAVALVDRAPHSSAARLYINWLLSRDGQAAWQRAVEAPSLRVDVPKDGLPPSQVPQPGVDYVDGGTEEYARLTPATIRDLITQGLAKAGRQ